MVGYCCAFKCSTIAGDGYSFHKFPIDETLSAKWCLAVRRSNFKPSKHSRLCSKHFTDEDFIKDRTGYRCLKKGTIPTVFDFPEQIGLSRKKSRKSPPLKRERSPTPETERLQEWLHAIKRTDLLESEHGSSIVYNSGRLCKRHFNDSCFTGKAKKKLTKYAIPHLPDMKLEQSTSENMQECDVTPDNNTEKSCMISRTSIDLENSLSEREHDTKIINSQPAAFKNSKQEDGDKFCSPSKMIQENIFQTVKDNKEPERIIGATKVREELTFLVKWKDVDEASIVSSTFLRKHFPGMLIQFYEERLVWTPSREVKKETT